MNSKRIEVGDIVDVCIHTGTDGDVIFRGAKTLHYPCDVGDSWRFQLEDGRIVAVQNFAYIIQVKAAEGK